MIIPLEISSVTLKKWFNFLKWKEYSLGHRGVLWGLGAVKYS